MGQRTCTNPLVIRESSDISVPDLLAQSDPPANSQDNDGNVKPDESASASCVIVRPATPGMKRHPSRGGPLC
jgi:hypothetical protein